MGTLQTMWATLLLTVSLAAGAAPAAWVDTDLSEPMQGALRELEAQLALELGLEDVSVQPLARPVMAALPPGRVSARLRPTGASMHPIFHARLQPWIEIRVEGVLRRTLAVPVSVAARRRVLEATQPLHVGEVLDVRNTRPRLLEAAAASEAFAAADLRPGHRLTEPIAAQTVVPRHAVRETARAVRGTVVPVLFRLAAVEVQAPGTLLDDEAREGQAVRVRLQRLPAPVRARRVQGQFVAIEDTGASK